MSRQHCSSTPDYNQPHEPAPPAYTPPPHAISTPNADPDNHAPTPSSTSATTDSNGGSKVPVNSFMYFRAHAVDMLCKKGLHHALFAIARDLWNEKTAEEKQWWKNRLDEANARCLLETGRDLVGQVPSYRIADLDATKIAAPGRVEELYSWYVRHPPPIKPRAKGKKSPKTRPERSFLQSGDHAPSNARHATRRRRRPRALRGVSQNDSDSSRSGSPSSVSTVQSSLGSDFAHAAAPAVYATYPITLPCQASFTAVAPPIFPTDHGQSYVEPSMQIYSSSEILASLHAQGEVISVDELERVLLDDASMPYLYNSPVPQQTVPPYENFPYAVGYQSDYIDPAQGLVDPCQDLQLLEALEVQGCIVPEATSHHDVQDSCYDQVSSGAFDRVYSPLVSAIPRQYPSAASCMLSAVATQVPCCARDRSWSGTPSWDAFPAFPSRLSSDGAFIGLETTSGGLSARW